MEPIRSNINMTSAKHSKTNVSIREMVDDLISQMKEEEK